ncbi:MAG: CHAT domain-containing protein [Anaerolineae bacterium]|jgi:hypothetical protein
MSALSGRFDDFEILIAADRGDRVYPVTVLESPAGQADGKFVLPMSDQELEAAMGSMQALATDEAMLTDFGVRVFSSLFHGDVLSRYAESVGITRERKGLRIRLRVVPPELAALPWELLYDPEKHEFLGLSKRALITRYLHVARPPSPLRTELPLRILIVIASPQGMPRLDSESEVARIEKALAVPLEHNLVQFDVLRKSTARALRDALLNPFHILHFIGHGDFHEGIGHLVFEDRWGDTDLVNGHTLGTLLKNTSVRLVVLNACQSAQNIQTVRVFTGVGPALVEAGIPAVVAMQFAIGDDSALVFTEDFYEMLSRYLPVDECISHACEGLMLNAGVGSVDWATPILFLRAPDGVIFIPEGVDRDEDDTFEKKMLYFCDLTTARPEPTRLAARLPEKKEIINHLWAMVDSPTYRRWATPHEALSRWVTPYQHGHWDELDRQDVAVVVDREPVTAILGDAGMGKTAILELLAYLYAERALRGDASALIPVFVKLSQYCGEGGLVPLIRTGLNRHRQINLSPEDNDAQTRTLLAERRFIILIDGLNHIPGDETQRAHGIAVVRRFLKEYPQHKYVISCRTLVYEGVSQEWKEWIILPHSHEDVRAYLIRRLGEARGKQLYQSLPDPMRELARTPLLLSLLLDELRDQGDQAAKQRALLFAHFTSRILSEKKGVIPVESQEALLAHLALAMKQDQTQEYSLADTLKLIASEARETWPAGVTSQGILDDLLASSLLRTGSTEQIAFAHPYCQDYFAAVALQEEFVSGRVDWESLTPGHRWRETILLLASMVEQPTALIRQLLAYDPLLAAECLLEVGAVNSGLPGQIGEALAERKKFGSKREKTRKAELLAALKAAGMASDAAAPQQGVSAGIDDRGEATTAITYPVRRGQLEVTQGSLAGLCIPLLDGIACLGRSSKANITLSERSVSRRHAEIRVTAENISIRDLGSTNGTRVNGQQTTTWRSLQDGDEIQLGELPLTVRISRN